MIRITQSRFETSAALVAQAYKAVDIVLQAKGSAFPLLTEREPLWTESKKVGQDLRKRFENLVVVGIGGSSLGGQVIAAQTNGTRLRFLENVDSGAIDRILFGLDLKTTGFLVVSKSGGTIETLASVDFLRERLTKAGLNFYQQSHVLTESKDNKLGKWAAAKNVPLTLIPNDVGGRYSVLSPVGMIPAVFDGVEIEKMREGARSALKDKDLVAKFIAQTALSYEREEWITLFWFYEGTGRVVGAWLQQLWAESLAKKNDRQGKPAKRCSSPLGALGAVDQHSLLQQVMDGAHDKFVVFVRSEGSEQGGASLSTSDFEDTKPLLGKSLGRLLQAEVLATEQALHQNGISTLTITTEVLDARGLGEFLMMMQLVVAGMGEFLGLDPFDQPGVELGKRLAHEILKKA